MESKDLQPLVEVVKEKKLTDEKVVTQPEVDNETTTNNNAFNTFRAIDLSTNDNKSTDSSQETEETEESEKNTVSDGRAKYGVCLGENGSDLLNTIAQLNSYVYKYNDTAKEIPYAKERGVDDDTHVGILAQELKANPITESTVKEDPLSGFLTIDTDSLTLTQQAILNAMAKRIVALEEKVYNKGE